ncbi:hypothetical protein HDU91_002004 [Kappamyces sp. JEL0680]|nr:hypothetical protein HDU91_002004 [Kappamyces sp. JEL0680]
MSARTPRLLLVFIHGFLGSHESFKDFPNDLKTHLEQSQEGAALFAVDVLCYPAYETRGTNSRQVQKLMDWLVFNGTSTKYSHVYLLAHSMGGLLSADAFRHLYKLQLKKPDSSSLLSRISSSVGSLFSYGPSPAEHSGDDMRVLVNIAGIITFDSPFFGLHKNVALQTALSKAREGAAEVPAAIKAIPTMIPVDVAAPLVEMIPERVNISTGIKDLKIPVSTTSLKDGIKSKLPEPTTAPAEPLLGATNLDLTKMTLGSASVGATLGAGLGGVLAMGVAVTSLDHIVSHWIFLEPLTSSHNTSLERVKILQQEHHSDPKIYFHAFYNVLPRGDRPEHVLEKDHRMLFTQPTPTSETRLFCNLPPTEVESHFSTLPSPLGDEIDAHMNMFDRQIVGGEHYFWLVEHVGSHIVSALQHVL